MEQIPHKYWLDSLKTEMRNNLLGGEVVYNIMLVYGWLVVKGINEATDMLEETLRPNPLLHNEMRLQLAHQTRGLRLRNVSLLAESGEHDVMPHIVGQYYPSKYRH